MRQFFIHVTELFDSAGTDFISVGIAGTEQYYITNQDASSTGRFQATINLAGYDEAGRAVYAYYVNGGAEPTQGKALVVICFIRVPPEP